MWMPTFDPEAAATLGRALRSAGYTTAAIEELLGEDGPSADLADVPVLARRLPATRLATVLRLFLLQLPVGEDAAIAALGRKAVDALAALGFAAVAGGELAPRARIVPTEGVYLSFDGFSQGADDPPGWVASFTPTAYWLASLTLRRKATRAVDIGTGNGAHALLAARHAGHVIATDVNERALAFTNISAALNGIGNVETRLGSLFEPVEGETFDLITCNAPYVVSPERRWAYRDGGLRRRRALPPRRHGSGRAPRRGRVRIGARQLARLLGGRPRRARRVVARGLRLRRVDPRPLGRRPARACRRLERPPHVRASWPARSTSGPATSASSARTG